VGNSFVNCTVLIYDKDKNQIASGRIMKHNESEDTVCVSVFDSLANHDECELFILTAGSPFVCHGIINRDSSEPNIKLVEMEERENRRETRYRIDNTAAIEHLNFDQTAYPLHTPLEVDLKNISKSGVRFRTRYNALLTGTDFSLKMKIGGGERRMFAYVVYREDDERNASEFGCKFVTNERLSYA